MGIVHRARDLNLDREVALKCPWPEYAKSPEARKRFMREARAASSLSHPNIVPVFEVFEEEGLPWLVMELVEGTSLWTALNRSGVPPFEKTLKHAQEIAEALECAHRKRILHRDVTPRNVLIGSDGRARLVDFGLARYFVPQGEESSAETQSTGTPSGVAAGTPGYMSPEQTLGKPLDARTDIFSFGSVLYEMCTGKHAFETTKSADVLDAILHREPVAMGRLTYEVPEEMERIVRKCLAKRAEERYRDGGDLLVDLRTLDRRLSSGERIAGGPRPARRASARMVGLMAGLVLVSGLALWQYYSSGGKPPESKTKAERPSVYYERGMFYLEDAESMRSLEDAIHMFHRAVEEKPDDAVAWAALGEAYWKRFDSSRDGPSETEATRAVDQAFLLKPGLAEAHCARGRGLLVKGDLEAARDELTRAVEASPGLDRAWAALGNVNEMLGSYSAGLKALRTAIRLQPDNFRYRIRLGLFHARFSEYDAATAAYRAAIDLKPDSTIAWNNLGTIYLQTGRVKEAIPAFSRSLEINENANARSNLGTAYYFDGDYERAVEQYLRATTIQPEGAVHWLNLGDAYRVLERREEAHDAYLEAVRIARSRVETNPNDAQARMELGFFCARAGENECALAEGKKAAEMQPESAEILFRTAIIFNLAGRQAEALDRLERAVKLGVSRTQIENDPDLSSLKQDPRFRQILDLAS